MNNSINVMVDLETLSTKSNAAILSIGATTFLDLPFDRASFYEKIDYNLWPLNEFDVSESTLDWWKTQDADIRAEAFSGTALPISALEDFNDWLKSLDSEIILWSYGANFDEVILQHAMDFCGIKPAWSYKNVRCFRTLVSLYSELSAPESNFFKHNALADAKYQAAWAEKILYTRSGRG